MPARGGLEAEDIAARKAFIEAEGLKWSVVESIPVHPAIKLGDNRAATHIDGWIETMRNLAANGLEVICYNFMPVVDWTRTDLRYPARRGGLALRFDPVEFAVYDLLVLRRANAQDTYAADIIAKAEALYATMDEAAIERSNPRSSPVFPVPNCPTGARASAPRLPNMTG